MNRTVHTNVVAAAAWDGRGDRLITGGRSRCGRRPYARLGVGAVGLGAGAAYGSFGLSHNSVALSTMGSTHARPRRHGHMGTGFSPARDV